MVEGENGEKGSGKVSLSTVRSKYEELFGMGGNLVKDPENMTIEGQMEFVTNAYKLEKFFGLFVKVVEEKRKEGLGLKGETKQVFEDLEKNIGELPAYIEKVNNIVEDAGVVSIVKDAYYRVRGGESIESVMKSYSGGRLEWRVRFDELRERIHASETANERFYNEWLPVQNEYFRKLDEHINGITEIVKQNKEAGLALDAEIKELSEKISRM